MVSIHCRDCHWRAYTINGSTWNTSGTVKRYPDLYCNSCCGDSHSGWSWSGNIVKYECKGCTNILYPVEWCDWKARPKHVYYGRCSGCRSAKERKERLEREQRERDRLRREREAKAARLRNAKTKPEYCPEYYSYSCASWMDVDYSIDSYNYLWTKCIIYCKAKRHSIYYQPNFSGSSKSACYYHSEITNKLSLSECPSCKQANKKAADFKKACKSAKAKIDNMSSSLDDITNMLKIINIDSQNTESKSDNDGNAHSSIADIEKRENEITSKIHEFLKVKNEISSSQQQNSSIINDIAAKQTFVSEDELDDAIKKLQDMSQKCAESKAQLHEQIQDANKREAKIIDEENEINNEMKDELTKQNKLNDVNERFANEKAKLISEFNGAELSAKGDDIQKLNQKFDKLLVTMQGKFKDSKERIDELKECQKRMKKIRAKIKKEKSDCKYLIQLINKECQRISEATDEAMDKFEQRTNYFLSVTVGLKQDIVEQFIDYDLEDIAELTEEDLLWDVNLDNASKSKLWRNIKKLKINLNV